MGITTVTIDSQTEMWWNRAKLEIDWIEIRNLGSKLNSIRSKIAKRN